MDIFNYKGICLREDKRAVYLDPSQGRPDGAVTHAHSDHLRPNTHMTRPTADVMKDAFEIEKDRYGFEEIISPAAKEYLDEVEKKAKKKKSDK